MHDNKYGDGDGYDEDYVDRGVLVIPRTKSGSRKGSVLIADKLTTPSRGTAGTGGEPS